MEQTVKQSEDKVVAYIGQTLHKKVLCLLRGAISLYCLAMIVATYLDASAMSIFHHFLTPDQAELGAAIYLTATVVLMLTGISMGPTAILLALYIFASRPMELPILATPEQTQALVRDVSLMVLLYVFAIFASVSAQQPPSWRHRQFVAPRRVQPAPHPVRVKRPAADTPVLTREKILSGELLPAEAPQPAQRSEEGNLFANVFDLQEERLQRA